MAEQATIRTIELPPHSHIIPGADDANPSDEHDEAYNAWATDLLTRALLEERAAKAEGDDSPPLVKTHYPHDALDGSTDDTLSLDREGLIVVIDTGAR